MQRTIASLLLLIGLAASAAAADWERGVALYKQGDYKAALAEFQDFVRQRPDAAGAWYYIGLCEFNLKRYDRVELPLGRAIDLLEVQTPASGDIAGAWYTIGLSHYLSSRYEQAIEPLKRYAELQARAGREIDPAARTALGRAYYYLERYDEALPLLSEAAKTGSAAKERAASLYMAGAIHFQREEDDRAIAVLRQAAEADAGDAATLELLAESLMRKARKANAAAAWNEAAQVGERLREVRDDEKTASILGRAYLGAQKFAEAVGPFEKLAKANPGNGQAWLYYGIALSRSGQMRRAMEALEITIQLLPESIPALAELGYVYESDKQYQQALRIYEKAFAASGDPAMQANIERVRALAAQQP